jgi:hypothetical protein
MAYDILPCPFFIKTFAMKESELEIKELTELKDSMSAIGKKSYYPNQYSDIFIYVVANAEHDKDLQRKITGFLKERGHNKVNAKNCPSLLKNELSKIENKDEAYKILASIHPDKDLILEHSHVEGCDCNKKLDAIGVDNIINNKTSQYVIKNANTIIVVGVAIVGLSILTLMLSKD